MNLFWKLFIAFGVSMALTLVGAVFVTFRLATLAFDQMNIENRETISERAAAALADDGEEGLRRWLGRNRMPSPGLEVMILDPAGVDLLGRPLPSRFQGLLQTRMRGSSRGPRNFRPPQFTATLTAPSGEEYRLLFVRTRITLLGVLTWPATQLAVLVLAIMAAALTSLLLARYLSSPIERLQRATRALAAGALETRVGRPFDRRRDEVGTLARDFDAMAEQIQALVTDKEVLMRDVSHELRSPLARIRVALALAQRKANEGAQTDLRRIELETERLDELVGQILTLARLRTRSRQQPIDVDLRELVESVIDNARFEHPDDTIRLEAGPVPKLRGNPGEIASAVENVLRNAIAHSAGPTDIRVRLRAVGDRIEIAIADRGPGVAESELKRIFEPFYRVDASRDHQASGYGLGLAIAARVIEKHGGRVTARNRPGGGLEVLLELPARPKSA